MKLPGMFNFYLLLLIIIVVPFIFPACDKVEGEKANTVSPGTGEPEIIDAFFCASVHNNQPIRIDNEFHVDDVVNFFIYWNNVFGKHRVQVIWLDPKDNEMETTTIDFESSSGKEINIFSLNTGPSAPAGKWAVEIYLDSNFYRSYSFWLLQGVRS